MQHDNTDTFFDIWIGFLRCFVNFGEGNNESRLTFVPNFTPRPHHGDGVVIRKHFRANGRWCETTDITRKEENDLAIIVNQAHLSLHRLILSKQQKDVCANANYESGTAWRVR